MTLITPLSALGRDDLESAGGKGANLGELVRLGLPVPDGFVVTTAAYAAVAEHLPIGALLAGLAPDGAAVDGAALEGAALEGADPGGVDPGGVAPGGVAPGGVDPGGVAPDGAAVRERFAQAEVPEAIRGAIAEAYAGLGAGPVAVRSSATAEDLPGAAFAGQQDTYLNVVGEDAVIDAVRRCWGSLWTDRAIAYRARRGVDNAEVRIAVVVQSMVDAEAAGVLFTADPVTGARDRIVVEAGEGLGEAVVSGLVTPDRYVLDTAGTVLERTPGRREVVVRSVAGGGVVHEKSDDAKADDAKASHAEADDAKASDAEADDAKASDAKAGDVRGSAANRSAQKSGDATVTRLPDTVLAELATLGARVAEHYGRPMDMEWACAGGRVSLVQARPMTAVPPPPVKLARRQRLAGRILTELIPYRPYPIDASSWIPYGPAGMMARIARRFGVALALDDFLVEEDGVVYTLAPPKPHPTARFPAGIVRIIAKARRHDPATWRDDPRFQRYLRDVARLREQDVTALPWSDLVRVPRRTFDAMEPLVGLRTDYLPGTGLALGRLRLAMRLLGRGDLSGDLVLGARTRTADANHALETLAETVRADPPLRKAVDAQDPALLHEFPEFQAALADFLAEFGHRETKTAILATSPTWEESPEVVLGMVKVLVAEPPERSDGPGDALRELLRHPRLRDPKRRARVERRVLAARAGLAFREDSHFEFTRPLPALRRALLEAGRRLTEEGVLEAPEEVYHLRLEELEGLASAADGAALRPTVRARAARRDELTGVRMLDPRQIYPREDDGTALVAGTPASGGTVTGPVAVVRGPEDFGKLRDGDVLVCPYTNPSWTPLFQRAIAVVVDTGATASHAAIVAREYGIPAVMGTANGTDTLADGQRVTVDGDTGRVTPADAEAS